MFELADRGQEALFWVLCIKPRLDRPAIDCKVFLHQGQKLAVRYAQLPLDQIDAGNRLGYRMFDLQAGVHLHEPDAICAQAFGRVRDELNRTCTDIVYCLGRADGGGAERLPGCCIHPGRGCFLDHLLVAALQRTVTLKQMNDIAVTVTEHLHLDMARALNIFLDKDVIVAKACRRLTPATGEAICKFFRTLDQPHTLAAAACHRLYQYRIADRIGLDSKEACILVTAHIARRHRHARLLHQLLGSILQPHCRNAFRVRANPDQPGVDHALRKFCVLGEEAIARMDRLCTGGLGSSDDPGPNKIAFPRRRRTDVNSLVRHPHMQRIGIRIRKNRDSPDTH